MSKLELKIEEKAVATPQVEKVLEKAPESFKERMASNWTITPGKGKGMIVASSSKGDRFEGHVKDFNKALKV